MWKTLADRALIDSRRLHIGLTRKWAAEGCDFIKKILLSYTYDVGSQFYAVLLS